MPFRFLSLLLLLHFCLCLLNYLFIIVINNSILIILINPMTHSTISLVIIYLQLFKFLLITTIHSIIYSNFLNRKATEGLHLIFFNSVFNILLYSKIILNLFIPLLLDSIIFIRLILFFKNSINLFPS